jgi:cold shock CspA family protein
MKIPTTKRFAAEGAITGTTDKNLGWIATTNITNDLFFHASELVNVQFDELRCGDKVHFDIVAGPKVFAERGAPIAINVAKNGRPEPESESEPTDITIDVDVQKTIESAAKRLAEIISMRPESLESIEWRDLERVIGTVFAGLGFEVELTPGSNDGGKDVLVTFTAATGRSAFIIEIKHWRAPVGPREVKKFLHVLARLNATGGLMLATGGFSRPAVEHLTEFERGMVRLGGKQKIVTLCKHYVKASQGTWYPPREIDEVILEDTM